MCWCYHETIPKLDGCCGADSAVAGANGGCQTMTASVGTGEYVTHGIINHPYFYTFALCDSPSMTTHASQSVVSMMINVQYDFIDDAEMELLSPLWVLHKLLLMFKRVTFIFYNGFTLFYIFHCATYTLLCFVCYLYDIMKCFVRNDEIKLWNKICIVNVPTRSSDIKPNASNGLSSFICCLQN